MDPLLTIKEIAALCKVSTRTVQAWIDDGKIVMIKLPCGWRMKQSNFERWVEGKEVRKQKLKAI